MNLKEKTLAKNYIYRGKVLTLRVDDALLPDGNPCKREVVEHSGGAAVLLEVEGKIALVRQYRYVYGEELLEIPAGKLNAGEEPIIAAARELSEETGYCAERLVPLLNIYPTPGYTNEKIYIYLAEGVKKGNQHLDSDEFLNVEYYDSEQVYQMILRGEIKDSKTIAAVFMARERKRQLSET